MKWVIFETLTQKELPKADGEWLADDTDIDISQLTLVPLTALAYLGNICSL